MTKRIRDADGVQEGGALVKKQKPTATRKKECKECGKWVVHLNQHMKDCHNVDAQLHKCPHCAYVGKRVNHLKNHLANRHDIGVQWKTCSQCDYKCKESGRLQKHLAACHDVGVKWRWCPTCDYKCKRDYHLRQHLANKHDVNVRWFPCTHCDFKCKESGALKNHLASIHGVGVRWFQCSFCEHRAKRECHLRDHIGAMHDVGELECPFCLNQVAKLVPYKDTNHHTSQVCRKCFKKASGHKSRAEDTMVALLRQHFSPYFQTANKALKGELCGTLTRPDVYLTFPEAKLHLFVECDEHQHQWSDYTPSCERGRMHQQCDEFAAGHKVFIRWNPDGFHYDSAVHRLPKPKCRKDRLAALVGYVKRLVARLQDSSQTATNMGVPEVHYMYYSANNPMVVPQNSKEFVKVFV